MTDLPFRTAAPLPRMYRDREVLMLLAEVGIVMSLDTLRRERKRRRLGRHKVGGRIYTTAEQVADYLTLCRSDPCQPPPDQARSGITGLHATQSPPTGAGHGTTQSVNKLAEQCSSLVRTTLSRRRFSSPSS